MNLRDRLSLLFASQLVQTPEGRAHVLNQIALAEGNGEARLFDAVLAYVDDPKLAVMVRKHRDDEVRHEQLFLASMRRTGVDPGPVPAHLRIMDRLDRALGGFLDRPVVDARGVMDSYLVLQVVEERALHQFAMLTRAFATVDPETAATFREVEADEQRHLRYCQAISKRYAPSEQVRTERLDALRDVEARVFQTANLANLRHSLEIGLIRGTLRRAAWTLLGDWSTNGAPLPYTHFRGAHDVQPLLAAAA